MSNFRPLAYREVARKLRKLGFVFRRSRGTSHEIWWNEKTRKTCVVPHHKEIRAGTIHNILKQAEIKQEIFFK